MSTLLNVSNLSVRYGKVEAVIDVTVEVGEGQVVTVIGPNGAGKTTLLAAIMGFVTSTGTVRYDGDDIRSMEIEDRLANGLCLVPEKRELFGDMTVSDNLLLGAYLYRRNAIHIRDGFERVYELFPRLKERRGQIANTLSGGERQMLALGRALMAKPRLLMLDEPSLGLAPLIVREIFRIIASLRELGVSVLLVEQNARAALETADFGYVLETGEVSIAGPAQHLLGDARVTATYLGNAS